MDTSNAYRFNKKYPFDDWTVIDGALYGYYPRNSIINILMQRRGIYKLPNKTLFIPDIVTSIKNSCFRGNKYYTKVYIPSTVKSISNNAFRDCAITLMVEKDTYALEYAKRKGLKYEVYEKRSIEDQSGSNQEA